MIPVSTRELVYVGFLFPFPILLDAGKVYVYGQSRKPLQPIRVPAHDWPVSMYPLIHGCWTPF